MNRAAARAGKLREVPVDRVLAQDSEPVRRPVPRVDDERGQTRTVPALFRGERGDIDCDVVATRSGANDDRLTLGERRRGQHDRLVVRIQHLDALHPGTLVRDALVLVEQPHDQVPVLITTRHRAQVEHDVGIEEEAGFEGFEDQAGDTRRWRWHEARERWRCRVSTKPGRQPRTPREPEPQSIRITIGRTCCERISHCGDLPRSRQSVSL